MKTKDIQAAIGKMQVLKYHVPVVENFEPLGRYEYDVMSIGSGKMIYEFEVKISRSDFLKPKEKQKHLEYAQSKNENMEAIAYVNEEKKISRWIKVPNYFSYACTDGLIQLHEIPDFSGLYYCANGEVKEIRKPQRIHDKLHDIEKINKKVLRTVCERNFLGCTIMSHENKIAAKAYKERKEQHEKMLQDFMHKHNPNKNIAA